MLLLHFPILSLIYYYMYMSPWKLDFLSWAHKGKQTLHCVVTAGPSSLKAMVKQCLQFSLRQQNSNILTIIIILVPVSLSKRLRLLL